MCLREDVEAYDGPPLEAMIMRGDWQFRGVVLCLRHHHPLVPLWTAARPSDRHDIGAHLNEIAHDLIAGKLDRQLQSPTAYDFWLDSRLENGRDATWLAQHGLYSAASFCRILGRELLSLESPTELNEISLEMRSRARGFEVASKGEASILAALKELMQFAISRKLKITGALGDLFYRRKSSISFDLDCFAPFHRILRQFAIENWPIETGEFVYGKPFPERILHSVRSASTEIGIGRDLLG